MNSNVWVLALAGAVSFGTPLVLAALGEILAERSGVLNLGVEGMMLVGAVTSFLAADRWDSVWLGLLLGILAGGALSLIHGVLSISLRANQTVAGLALTIFGTALANYAGKPVDGKILHAKIVPMKITGLADIPVLGPVLFAQDVLVYATIALVVAVAFYVTRTRAGLALRAVGESPATADAQGISVTRVRYAHVALGGLFAGAAGAYQVLARVQAWNQQATTNGIGWIALALVIFGAWRPGRVLFGAVLFGFALRANFTLQAAGVHSIAPQLLSMLPYVLTILVLIVVTVVDRTNVFGAPAALGQPFVRDER